MAAWHRQRSTPARTARGGPARDQVHQAEHARAAELNAVIRAMGEGVIVCTVDGRISLANPAAEQLFEDIANQTYPAILGQLHDPHGLAPVLGLREGPVQLPTVADPATSRLTELKIAALNPAEKRP